MKCYIYLKFYYIFLITVSSLCKVQWIPPDGLVLLCLCRLLSSGFIYIFLSLFVDQSSLMTPLAHRHCVAHDQRRELLKTSTDNHT